MLSEQDRFGFRYRVGNTLHTINSRLRTAFRELLPSIRWALHSTDDPADLVLQIYVPSEGERVRVRELFELGTSTDEGDSYESHKQSNWTISIIEDVNDFRSDKGERTRTEN